MSVDTNEMRRYVSDADRFDALASHVKANGRQVDVVLDGQTIIGGGYELDCTGSTRSSRMARIVHVPDDWHGSSQLVFTTTAYAEAGINGGIRRRTRELLVRKVHPTGDDPNSIQLVPFNTLRTDTFPRDGRTFYPFSQAETPRRSIPIPVGEQSAAASSYLGRMEKRVFHDSQPQVQTHRSPRRVPA